MEETSRNFIEQFIAEDIAPGGRFEGRRVHTRFPPEPNGYLHIGHCKALVIDFGTAERFGGICNLRMDDTNPAKEDTEYVDAIKEDIHWLGFDWGRPLLLRLGLFRADLRVRRGAHQKGPRLCLRADAEQFREYRGDVSTPARSPWRDRPMEESLDLFRRMRAGEFPDNKYTLRAKIDLASGNFQYARPGHIPDTPRGASPPGHEVVHLSHVRLRAPHSGRARGHHALALLAGVRGAQAPLRLGREQRLRPQ